MAFLELKTRSGGRFMIDFASGWEIRDKGKEAALWDNPTQARNLDCGETYEDLRAKLLAPAKASPAAEPAKAADIGNAGGAPAGHEDTSGG